MKNIEPGSLRLRENLLYHQWSKNTWRIHGFWVVATIHACGDVRASILALDDGGTRIANANPVPRKHLSCYSLVRAKGSHERVLIESHPQIHLKNLENPFICLTGPHGICSQGCMESGTTSKITNTTNKHYETCRTIPGHSTHFYCKPIAHWKFLKTLKQPLAIQLDFSPLLVPEAKTSPDFGAELRTDLRPASMTAWRGIRAEGAREEGGTNRMRKRGWKGWKVRYSILNFAGWSKRVVRLNKNLRMLRNEAEARRQRMPETAKITLLKNLLSFLARLVKMGGRWSKKPLDSACEIEPLIGQFQLFSSQSQSAPVPGSSNRDQPPYSR